MKSKMVHCSEGHAILADGPPMLEFLCRERTLVEACEWAKIHLATIKKDTEKLEVESGSNGFIVRFIFNPLTYWTPENCSMCLELKDVSDLTAEYVAAKGMDFS